MDTQRRKIPDPYAYTRHGKRASVRQLFGYVERLLERIEQEDESS